MNRSIKAVASIAIAGLVAIISSVDCGATTLPVALLNADIAAGTVFVRPATLPYDLTETKVDTYARGTGVAEPLPKFTAESYSTGFQARVQVSFAYWIGVTALPGAPAITQIPIIINAKAELSQTPSSQTENYARLFYGNQLIASAFSGPSSQHSFNVAVPELLGIGFQNAVELQLQLVVVAQVSLPGQTQLETGYIDPLVTIDPSFQYADLFQIVTSEGIGNSPAAATPVPAALPLFATGLVGGLGLLGWRRRRSVNRDIAAPMAA